MNSTHKRHSTSLNRSRAAPSRETIPQLKAEIENLRCHDQTSLEIPIDRIIPLQLPGEMKQPRLYYDPRKMELLRKSIQKHGVLEPIFLRRGQADIFEIISGERRWRCCQALGIPSIPAIVRNMSDGDALEAALIAHLLNEEISTIEQTESILGLLSLRFHLSTEAVKTSLYQLKNSRTRGMDTPNTFSEEQIETIHGILSEFGLKLSSFVSNRLPLLNLRPNILSAVREGRLSPTNAVLINRQPQESHEFLMSQAEGKTKKELADLIRATANLGMQPAKKRLMSDQIHERFKSIIKQPELLVNPDVAKRLMRIDVLLQEIEAIGGQSSSKN